MSTPNAYLLFDGNCAQAMRHYEKVLGGKLERLVSHREAPASVQVPSRSLDRIMHARLAIPGGVLLASDWMVDRPYEPMQGFYVSLSYATAAEAERIYATLRDGGRVMMPLAKTFFVEAFGMLVDRYGTPWMISGGAMPAL